MIGCNAAVWPDVISPQRSFSLVPAVALEFALIFLDKVNPRLFSGSAAVLVRGVGIQAQKFICPSLWDRTFPGHGECVCRKVAIHGQLYLDSE